MSDDEYMVVLLMTSVSPEKLVKTNIASLEQLLYVKNIPYYPIDGAEAENKEIKEKLWNLSNKRLQYPLLFLQHRPTGNYTFLGDWHTIHHANEHNDHTGAFDKFFVKLSSYEPTSSIYHPDNMKNNDDDDIASKEEEEDENTVTTNSNNNNVPPTATVPSHSTASSSSTIPSSSSSSSSSSVTSPSKVYTWEECTSSKGEKYWFHRGTGESSWVNPFHAIKDVWIPQTDSKGRAYYYNRRTGKSQWQIPI